MQYVIEIDRDKGWGIVNISGDIGMAGLRQLLAQAWSHPAYGNIERATWNLLDASTDLSLDDLFELTQWILENKQDQGARIIAIVASDDLMFGMSRMFHAIQDNFGWTVGVFRTETEAHKWLEQQSPADHKPAGD